MESRIVYDIRFNRTTESDSGSKPKHAGLTVDLNHVAKVRLLDAIDKVKDKLLAASVSTFSPQGWPKPN